MSGVDADYFPRVVARIFYTEHIERDRSVSVGEITLFQRVQQGRFELHFCRLCAEYLWRKPHCGLGEAAEILLVCGPFIRAGEQPVEVPPEVIAACYAERVHRGDLGLVIGEKIGDRIILAKGALCVVLCTVHTLLPRNLVVYFTLPARAFFDPRAVVRRPAKLRAPRLAVLARFVVALAQRGKGVYARALLCQRIKCLIVHCFFSFPSRAKKKEPNGSTSPSACASGLFYRSVSMAFIYYLSYSYIMQGRRATLTGRFSTAVGTTRFALRCPVNQFNAKVPTVPGPA